MKVCVYIQRSGRRKEAGGRKGQKQREGKEENKKAQKYKKAAGLGQEGLARAIAYTYAGRGKVLKEATKRM